MAEMYAVITQNGKEIFKVEKSLENDGEESMKIMVTHIRDIQEKTNVFLTGLIENTGGNDDTGEDEEAEESDDEINEPENKLPRLQ